MRLPIPTGSGYRIAQGLEYYLRFVERFPDVRSLAGAHEDEVMKLWQGLGYYSRARNLHAAAREVSGKYAGLFPADYASVRALKGIGDYTAAAICSFAFGLPHATVMFTAYWHAYTGLRLLSILLPASGSLPFWPVRCSIRRGRDCTTRR